MLRPIDPPQPRRRRPGLAARHPDLYRLGDPLRQGLTAEVSQMSACVQEAVELAEQLALPDLSQQERERLSRCGSEQQAATAFVLANLLRDDAELRALTGVRPEDLLELLKKESQMVRLAAGMEQLQSDAADGKLMASALFDFYEERALDLFERKLQHLPERERQLLLGEMAGLHTLLRQAAEERAARQADEAREREALQAQLQDTRDELDFLTARAQARAGQPVDPTTLPGAERHLGRRGEPTLDTPPRPGRERRRKPR